MQRRTLLTVGIVAGALLVAVGGTVALLRPGRRDGKLTEAGRAMFAAVARAVLGPLLAQDSVVQAQVLRAHLDRVQATIAGMPPALQAEVDELVTLVASAPGRIALVGLHAGWQTATEPEVTAALQGMRDSSLALRQQAFHALRDISNASYFAGPTTWAAIGYPGPRAL